MLIAYNLIWLLVYIITLPYVIYKRGRAPEEWRERMGRYPFDHSRGEKCVWIHGASLGEIAAASNLVRRLRETHRHRRLIVSAMTVAGKERAREIMEGVNGFVLMPFDFLPLMHAALKRVNPETLILIETEIWPTLLFLARKQGVHIVIANARLSESTYRRYRRFRSLSAWLFNQIDLYIPKNEAEKQKFITLGVQERKIQYVGCLKSDNGEQLPISREALCIPRDRSIVVAGSVRKGEEGIVIEGFRKVRRECTRCYLIIAPRHLNRVAEIEAILAREGLTYMKRTGKTSYNGEQVMVLDTVGELRNVYAVADVAFVGGTLLPYGGHNPLEPASFGVPILFGPHVNNIRTDADELIEQQCAIIVRNNEEFAAAVTSLLRDHRKRRRMGSNARAVLERRQGIVDRYMGVLEHNGMV
jgi:3-deoxy-D-manno-octulosonic-acid transferase